ncbi:MAG: GAF domain-containing protein, partial [Gemmatimonadota bacterium]|nr:GAF domain-containing protein [Gemmatimonadota bacterium]
MVEAQHEIATAGLDMDAVMRTIVEQTQALTGAAGVVIELVEGEEMVYRGVGGAATPHLGLRLRVDGSLSGLCVRTGRILRCDDCEQDERVDREACRRVGARSLVVAPLSGRERVLGALKIYSPEPNAFGDADVHALQLLGSLLASAIEDAQRFEAVEALVEERRRAEQALRQERDFTEAILGTAGALIVAVDREGKVVRFNRACEQVTGYSEDEVRGRHYTMFLPSEEAEAVHEVVHQAHAGQFPNQHENHWVTKSGERRRIAWTNTVLLDERGEVEHFV